MTMMDAEACFGVWAPDGALWSAWAKPALFASSAVSYTGTASGEPIAPIDQPVLPEAYTPTAVVIDMPGIESIRMGMAMAMRGFRPVPLFNGTTGPLALVDNDALARALGDCTGDLARMTLAPDAKPAFLLDSRRLETHSPAAPGRYDNRWVTLPQDFPSATLLQHHGIEQITLIVSGGTPMQDLSHVARRWQEAGLRIRVIDPATWQVTDPYDVTVPSLFRRAWYAAATLAGFRRANVGGFGSQIPEQTRSSGFYG
jgi:hypothetical protein